MNIKSTLPVLITMLMTGEIIAQQQSSQTLRGKRPVKTAVDSTIKRVYKEITQEAAADKNTVVKINNTTCNLDIRPWPEAKVKMVTTIGVAVKDTSNIPQEEMLEEAGIIFKSFGNRVDVQTRTSFAGEPPQSFYRSVGSTSQSLTPAEAVDVTETIFPNEQDRSVRWMTAGTRIRSMILYVPEDCRLDVDNRNTGIVINADIADARFKLNRSSLDARNFGKLFISAEYYSINISDVNEAELELESGNFTGGIIRTMDLDSKNSEIDYESGQQLYVRSQADKISLDEIERVTGRKLYGDLRLGKLTGELDIEGTNSDIKIRNIAPLVEKIKVTDQYANLRLPVKNISNFTLSFGGENSTVFAPFEKIAVSGPDTVSVETLKAAVRSDKELLAVQRPPRRMSQDEFNVIRKRMLQLPTGQREAFLVSELRNYDAAVAGALKAPVQFKAQNGDLTGRHTKFEISCSNCTVDFK